MKRRLRQRQILELLQRDSELSVDQACEWLHASPATIRREFVELAREARVEKTWGGIRLLPGEPTRATPPAFASRLVVEAMAKKAIARAAADLLSEGDVVMIGGGTTTLQLAEFIALKRLRIVTNSLAMAQALDQWKGSHRGAEIHLAGGLLQPESGFVAGSQTEAFIRQYHASWAFLGAAGIDETAATNYNEAVLASERLMIAQSARVAILADHTKLGRKAMCLLCPLEGIDYLVTDEFEGNDELFERIAGEEVKVIRVPVKEDAQLRSG
ncbi:MAG: DeoR/GlpR family DNA-binding transcription regulator [Verrucomicrobiota bacterium]